MNESSPPRARRIARVVFAAALLAFGSVYGGSRASAQILEGRVIDDATGAPIVQATVAVVLGDRTVAGSLTDEAGRFTIRLPDPNNYLVRVSGQGYAPLAAEGVAVARRETLVLADYRLEPRPIALEAIIVETDAGKLTGAEKFRRRQALGQGTFFSGTEIASLQPRSLTDYLAQEADLEVHYDRWGHPYLWSPVGPYHCLVLQVNHWPLGTQGFNSLDEIPFEWIAGIEIYNTVADVPPESALVGYTTEPRLYPGERCGLLNVWFWKSW